MDLLDSSVAERCLREIENYEWDVVLVTPPCSTFSRARCVQPGPRPLRSRLYPLGFPWLSDAHRTVVEQGNEFVSFSFRICAAALSNSIPFLLEHPEDLGTTSTGHTPASIWQLPEALALFKHESVVTFSVYQCQYGAASPKPTRFLSSIRSLFGMPHVGPPRFDTTGRYLGPLPRYCGHRHKDRLLGSASTAASAAYPAGLCAEMATWIFSVFDGGVLLLRGLGRVPLRVSSFLSLLGPFRFPPDGTLPNCLHVTALKRDRSLRIRSFGYQSFCQTRTGFVNLRRQCKANDLSHQVPLSTRTGLGSDATWTLFPSLQSSWQGWWPTTFQDGYSLRLLSSGT